MSPEVARLRDPKRIYLDEVDVTFGYVGDFFQPNFFNRAERLSQSNYHQFLIAKKLGKRFQLSTD